MIEVATPGPDATITQARLAAGLVADARLVCALVDEQVARDLRLGPQDADHHRVPQEICFRAAHWLRSTTKLGQPYDVFCVAAAARAILESVVDASLTYQRRDGLRRLEAWEESSQLAAAEKLIAACRRTQRGGAPGVEAFIAQHGRRIKELRKTLWNEGRHPQRWTGARSLDEDVRAVDRLEPQPFYLGAGLSDFYPWFYHSACGFVHGSGLATVRGPRNQSAPQGFFYFQRHATALLLLCVKLCVRAVDCSLISQGTRAAVAEVENALGMKYIPLEASLRASGY